jgi:signal transduction histidine kinase/DNA-binding response OmpR family regulator
MKSFFEKIPLAVKLILVGLIPLLFLIFLAFELYNEKTRKISMLQDYITRANQSVHLSGLIEQLQTERRYSFGYVIEKNWRRDVVLQRPQTDAALKRLSEVEGERLRRFREYSFLDSLDAVRAQIDRSQLTPQEVMDYYTNTIFRLNTLNNIAAGSISFLGSANNDIVGQKLLSEMITYLGRIRSNIYYSLYINTTGAQSVEQLRNVYGIYKSFEKEFLLKASKKSIIEYNNLMNQSDLRTTMNYIQQSLQTRQLDTTIDVEDWWNISANAVDNLKTLQRNILDAAYTELVALFEKEKQNKDRALILLVLIIALALFVVTYTIKVISDILKELKEAAQKIAVGEPVDNLKVKSNDVIGSLTRSIQKIDANNKVLAEAADAIGRGNFSVDVVPRSEKDLLGNAVAHMKDDLKQYSEDSRNKIWIHNGLTSVNDNIRGEKDIDDLCTESLNAVVKYTNADVALFYVANDGYLQYKCGHAIPELASIPDKLVLGETLVGQAAIKKEMIILTNVQDHLRIKSATTDTQASHIIILPLVHNNIVEGVIELAFLQPPASQVASFVQQTNSNIAIALQAAKSRQRLQELFSETQAQAEELQAQHTEMEVLNSDLEIKTQKLQASEEELKVQQEELMQTNQELEERSRLLEEKNQLIVERNFEIQKKAEELQLSTKYKSEFLANMSHELRTPLNSILLLSRLLTENNEKNLSTEQVEYAKVIQSSGHGLLSLIDEILDLSKIEAGKLELEINTVKVEDVIEDMKALFAPVAKDKKLAFEIKVDKNITPVLETDKMRLEQILKNLLSNAIKFTSKGSVVFSVSDSERNGIRFSVKDTGIGIAKENQQHIFEAFQQADGSTRRKFGGTGLGLSISRELAKLLGGEILLSSEPGSGSEFILSLPLSNKKTSLPTIPEKKIENEEQQKEEKPERQQFIASVIPENIPDDRSTVTSKDQTILIIEDDVNFAKALLDYTRKKGYKGIVAVRGDEGVELAKQFRPSGILLDIQLPVKDGWAVMEELKTTSSTRHIPVHIMSSYQVKKESLLHGAVDFINKPVALDQMQEVFKKIEEVLKNENRKVLIVEENDKHAKALSYFLQTFNVQAEIRQDVHSGITALKREDVDCVILDMGVPDKKLYDTLEDVKKNPDFKDLPIIIFTGKHLSNTEEKKIKQFANSIVVKTAQSYQRILDEVSLFLHLMEESNGRIPEVAKYKNLGAITEVLGNKKILIVDDDVRNIFSLTKVLEAHKMNVLTAVDGKEALKRMEENTDMDVVLMDIMMPEMDGYEAIKQIRKQFKFRNLPIIAVTAKAMTGDREKCIKAGASDYISKPVDIDQLLSLLRVWLYEKISPKV